MELISRKQVLDILNVDFNYILMLCDEEKRERIRLITATTLEDIKILPRIKSTPKGEWKMLSSGFFECTNCYCRSLFPIFSNGEYATYCPSCGAYMRSEENENSR